MPQYDPNYEPRLNDYDGDLSKRWYIRFRVWDTDKQDFVLKDYKGLNKYKTLAARRKAAKQKLDEIRILLTQGYTAGNAKASLREYDIRKLTLRQAMDFFLNAKNRSAQDGDKLRLDTTWNPEGALSYGTFKSYRNSRNQVVLWQEASKLEGLRLLDVDTNTAHHFFEYLHAARQVAGKTFNHHLTFMRAVYSFFGKREEHITIRNPFANVAKQKVPKSRLHAAFSGTQIELIHRKVLEKGDRQLYLFIQFIYYTFARPGLELRLLQVKDIRDKTIYIPGERSKNNEGEHVSIPKGLEQLIGEYKLRSYPPQHYVFTTEGIPGPVHVGKNYFYKRHAKILEELGMDDKEYTIYGYKHTGAINLYRKMKDIKKVQQHCRHSTIHQTDQYLRDLGVLAEEEELDF
jgi:site-specific recombinase XerD